MGHLLNEHGHSFPPEKLKKVSKFPMPTTLSQLKSFVGLSNFFRDSVPGFSKLQHPLNELLHGYKKKSKKQVPWNAEAIEAFEKLKEAVDNCQTIYFLNDKDPVFLMTDASDYGVGAYLYQLVGAEKHTNDDGEVQYKGGTHRCTALGLGLG